MACIIFGLDSARLGWLFKAGLIDSHSTTNSKGFPPLCLGERPKSLTSVQRPVWPAHHLMPLPPFQLHWPFSNGLWETYLGAVSQQHCLEQLLCLNSLTHTLLWGALPFRARDVMAQVAQWWGNDLSPSRPMSEPTLFSTWWTKLPHFFIQLNCNIMIQTKTSSTLTLWEDHYHPLVGKEFYQLPHSQC